MKIFLKVFMYRLTLAKKRSELNTKTNDEANLDLHGFCEVSRNKSLVVAHLSINSIQSKFEQLGQ